MTPTAFARTLPALLLLIGLMAALPAAAQTEVAINYEWAAPACGSAVDHYVVEHSADDGPWTQIAVSATTSYTLTAAVGVSHRIRIAAVDALDRSSDYSEISTAITPDLGPPCQPGQPAVI